MNRASTTSAPRTPTGDRTPVETGKDPIRQWISDASHLPFLAGMTLITGLAAIGFPGTTGFIALEMLLEGVAEVYPAVGIVVAMTAALNGISVMRAYFHLFTGVKHSTTGSLSCVRVERLAILGILLLILGGGLFPQLGVSSRYEAAKDLMEHRSPTHSLPNQD